MTAVGYVGGDPSKVDVTGYAHGDLLAADASGTLTPVPIGTAAQALTVDVAETTLVDWETGGGGGGGVPSGTVVTETSFAQASTAGVATDYSRGDHTHGTPAAPTPVSVGADPAGSAAAAVITANAYTDAGLATAARRPVVRQSRITTGNVTFPNTTPTWTINATLNAPQIPAAIGDTVEVGITALFGFSASAFIDIAVITGVSTIARYMGSGTSSPLLEGNPGLYPTSSSFTRALSPQSFVVEAADLDGGNVRFALVSRAAGAGQAFANTNYPFAWLVKNLGPVN